MLIMRKVVTMVEGEEILYIWFYCEPKTALINKVYLKKMTKYTSMKSQFTPKQNPNQLLNISEPQILLPLKNQLT